MRRTYDAVYTHQFKEAPKAVFDGFIAMYGDARPGWIAHSRLDLREGGAWTVDFHPPGVDAFRENRLLTVVDRPFCLAYDMSLSAKGKAGFSTHVTLCFIEKSAGTLLLFTQSGFPDQRTRDDFGNNWPRVFEQLEERLRTAGN